ncbi:hypothetical protein [Deinococcus aluminii]|uniref:Lipoprotein n=1 Tax=Deinococcus aluminii TaxID=1656885 RepID=A0ABP9XFN2_9DEIO
MRLGGGLALALLLGSTLALVATPTDAERQAAVQQGEALAGQHQGYPVRDYLLYSVPDALALTPGEGSVEAVQVATPLERARWAGYFLTIQGKPVTPDAVQHIADMPPDRVEFIVYAHSNGPKDQDFLGAFGPATMLIGEQVLPTSAVKTSGASLDNYRDADGQVVFRWTDAITYRFRVPEGATTGHLRFTDATGKKYDLPFDLSRYR